jgi:hypothetical protein
MLNTADGRQTVPQTVLPDYHLVKGSLTRFPGHDRCGDHAAVTVVV